MATVRMTLAAAGLMVCGLAYAGDRTAENAVAPSSAITPVNAVAAATALPSATRAAADTGTPAASSAVKPKAAKASDGSKKPAKPSLASKSVSGRMHAKSPVSGRMQVEEPKAAAPMSLARESKAWQKSHSRGLTDAQKNAFRERKESMESMIAVIKEKRKALRDAKPEERAALARELHSLILEKDPAAGSSVSSASASTARVGAAAPETPRGADNAVANGKSSGQAAQHGDAKKSEAAEAAEYRRKRIEANQEQLRRKEEIRKQQLEKFKSSLENGLSPVGDLSEGREED